MMDFYHTPKNKEEYWFIVNEHWRDIFVILNQHLPLSKNEWIDNTPINKMLGEYILELKDKKNPRLARVLNAALYYIPKETQKYALPSWAQFYDLCVMEKILL